MWLTGDATWYATAGPAEDFSLPGAAALAELRDTILRDGQLTVCTQCAGRRGLSEADLIPGVRIAGAAAFVEEALSETAQALVY